MTDINFDEYEFIDAQFLAKTEKAVLLKVAKRKKLEAVWFPLSQIHTIQEANTGIAFALQELEKDMEVSVHVKVWLLDKLGVDYDRKSGEEK